MNPTRHPSRAVLRSLTLALGALGLLGLLGLSGCVREHLSKRYGVAANRLIELQIQPRLSQQDQPAPLAAEDAELVIQDLRKREPGGGGGGASGSTMMQLLPLQR